MNVLQQVIPIRKSDARSQRAPEWLSPNVVLGLLRACDVTIVIIAGVAAFLTRFGTFFPPGGGEGLVPYALICAALLTANVFHLVGLYRFDDLANVFYQSRRTLIAWSTVILCLLALGFITKTVWEASRLWIGLWFVYGYIAIMLCRAGFKWRVRCWQQAGHLTHNIVIVGAGEHGQRFVEHLRRNESKSGIRLIGLFDDRKGRVPDYVAGYPVLGTVDDLLHFARENPIDQVIIALPWDAESRLLSWIKRLKNLPVDVRLCPDMIGFHLTHRNITHLAGVPLLNVYEKPLSGWSWVVKTLEDRILAAAILLMVAPLMAFIALAIRFNSPGPILFRQKRYGLNNEVIEVFKFRSMYHDKAENGTTVHQARKDDDRITKVGRFIRRTSLDELPQFLNVLRGDMSIVGPRPHAVAHNEQYARLIDEYLARHRVKPGITGWAQVNGLRGETETLDKMEKRVQYDLHYIENWSLIFDLRIIIKTLLVGFVSPNAY